jgi:hypothetical protein
MRRLRPTPRRVSKRKAWIYGHGNRPSGHSKITSKTIATTTKVSATATTVCRTSFAFLCLSADLLGERTSTQRKTLHAKGGWDTAAADLGDG